MSSDKTGRQGGAKSKIRLQRQVRKGNQRPGGVKSVVDNSATTWPEVWRSTEDGKEGGCEDVKGMDGVQIVTA